LIAARRTNPMTLLEAIREFFLSRTAPASLPDLYSALPSEKKHSLRARIYENLGRHFKRVGKGVYVAVEGEATCVVVQGDAWEETKKIPSRSVDCVVTDPPYPWLDHFVERGTTRRRLDWGYEKREIDRELGLELFRVLKDGAHAFIFVPAETGATRKHIEKLIGILEGCGFVFNKRFIWDKLVLGMGYNGRNRYEGILFMSKGKKRMPLDFSIPDVLDHPALDSRLRSHESEKPCWVIEQLIKFATAAGEIVLDCFAGSLSTGRAALGLGRSAILIEKDAGILAKAVLT